MEGHTLVKNISSVFEQTSLQKFKNQKTKLLLDIVAQAFTGYPGLIPKDFVDVFDEISC